MSIPFGAIVYDATQVGVAPGKAMLLVRFSRRSSDGSYAGEEIATIHEAQACRLVRTALERGESGFWGSWFGLPDSAWTAATRSRKGKDNISAAFPASKNKQFSRTI